MKSKMSLIKVNYDEIWETSPQGQPIEKDGQKKGVLYRGNSQEMFELRAIESTAQGRAAYWGLNNQTDGMITFCDTNYLANTFYTIQQFEHNSVRIRYPYANYPLMMAINAENYKDRIYRSTQGEGFIIKGRINLEDITILYSTQIDRYYQSIPAKSERYKEFISKEKKWLEELLKKTNIPKQDLLDNYKADPESAAEYIRLAQISSNPRLSHTKARALEKKVIAILQEKLRQH
jgi:hypothetical protein